MGISAFSIAYLKIIRKIRLVTYISYVFSKNYKTTFNNYKQALCINKFQLITLSIFSLFDYICTNI